MGGRAQTFDNSIFEKPLVNRSVLATGTISLALHALVASFLLVRFSTPLVRDPIGIDLLYPGQGASISREVPPPHPRQNSKSRPSFKPMVLPVVAEADKATPSVENQPKPEPSATTAEAAADSTSGLAGRRDGAVVSALERYKYELRLFLESRKIYPETAKRLRQTGTVVVQFKVSAAGDLTDVNVERASPSEVLNRAAVDLIRQASRFKPFPVETALSEMKLSLPIEYIL